VRPAIALLVCFAVLLAACGDTGTPTPIAEAPIDAAAVERLLTKDDIEDAGGSADGLDARVEDLREVAGMVDPVQIEGVDAWFSRTITSLSRPGVLLSLRRFADPTRALGDLQGIQQGGAFEAMDPPVGDRSAIAQGDTPEQGTAIAFVKGRTLVVLQCPAATDGTTLLDPSQLTSLAEVLASRL